MNEKAAKIIETDLAANKGDEISKEIKLLATENWRLHQASANIRCKSSNNQTQTFSVGSKIFVVHGESIQQTMM